MCDRSSVAHGWRYEIIERDWSEVRATLEVVDWHDDDGQYLLDVIDSVLEVGADEVLALSTSMHDLMVAPRPVSSPPLDVVVVAAPGSGRSHAAGTVRIDHIAVNGPNTEIERPADQAVPLFWRVLWEEFGITAVRPDRNRP